LARKESSGVRGRLLQWRVCVLYAVMIMLGILTVRNTNQWELFVGGMLPIGFVILLWITYPPS
jgi:hypothetical protein